MIGRVSILSPAPRGGEGRVRGLRRISWHVGAGSRAERPRPSPRPLPANGERIIRAEALA
jgi:hypothetical protein